MSINNNNNNNKVTDSAVTQQKNDVTAVFKDLVQKMLQIL